VSKAIAGMLKAMARIFAAEGFSKTIFNPENYIIVRLDGPPAW
jgi:hypothetical protein